MNEEKLEQKVGGVLNLAPEFLSKIKQTLGKYAYWKRDDQYSKLSYASGFECDGESTSCAEINCHGDDSCGGDV